MTRKSIPNVPAGRYWAGVDRERLGAVISERFRRYQRAMDDRGQRAMWRKNHLAYYGQDPSGGYANSAAIAFGGEQGELALIHMPEYRQLVQAMHTLATSQRPAIEATATTNDPEAQSQTIVARQVIDYDLDEGGLEQALLNTHERALVYAEGYIVDEWDFDAGDLITAEEAPAVDSPEAVPNAQPAERPVYSGAPQARAKSPMDVARDVDCDTVANVRWYIVRDPVNCWEMAARYPEHASRILNAPEVGADEDRLFPSRDDTQTGESDYVYRLTLYHLPTPALPRGRYAWVIDEAVILDTDYPYDHMVVHADVPGEEMETPIGYSAAWDLLALQQALNAIESNLLTTSEIGGTPSWIARKGQNVDARMAEGLRILEYDGEAGDSPPRLAEQPPIDNGRIKLAERYRNEMQIVSGINSTVRGESTENSGAHAALIASMAVQANSGQQRSYARLMRSCFNGRIKLYQRFATEPRVIELTGRDSIGHVREFTKADLRRVRRVRVELANPYLRTVQGRKETADRLVELFGPQVITPDRYLLFQQTGRMDDLENREATHKVNARKENDQFRAAAEKYGDPIVASQSGEVPKPMVTDHHPIHIRECLAEIDDPAVRLDPSKEGYRALILAHAQAHAQMWRSADPALLAALGVPPAPAPMGPPPGAGPPGPPMPGGVPPIPSPPPDAAVPGAAGLAGDLPQGLPQQPINPATGQRGPGLPIP